MVPMKTVIDKTIQLLYFILFRVMLCYWFVVRPQFFGAYVAVWWQDRLLIIKNSYKSRYTVPCGAIGRKETPVEAAVRELKEEVNIALPPEQLRLASQFTISQEFKQDNIVFFEVSYDQRPTFKIDNREVVWARFLTISEAETYPLSMALSEYLRRHAATAAAIGIQNRS